MAIVEVVAFQMGHAVPLATLCCCHLQCFQKTHDTQVTSVINSVLESCSSAVVTCYYNNICLFLEHT